jgi:hypothetical protein
MEIEFRTQRSLMLGHVTETLSESYQESLEDFEQAW